MAGLIHVMDGTAMVPVTKDMLLGVGGSSGGSGSGSGSGSSAAPAAPVGGERSVATAGTAVPLLASAKVVQWVTIHARSGNQGRVVLGGSSTATMGAGGAGHELAPGEAIALPAIDLSKLYLNAEIAADGVRFLYGLPA